ncbi:mepB protein [Elizabethkingia argentiflava]|uniref:MepB protein n=1 Tax=Elizabethkingia argenteiflava TaxID=2681556 RepID=A0A845PS72_9FLAO|nr:MepB family protein [Elizabethkingia argenteiflava]NAW50684.1 mepB protein [Elizabethkingia argenteiflava]
MKQTIENIEPEQHNWETSPETGAIPFQLRDFTYKVFKNNSLKINNSALRDHENLEYGGSSLSIGGKNILFRVAKTTPTKVGQFVALYKRSGISGKITPLDFDDRYDYVFIASFNKQYHGVFIFNKEVLIQKGIFSKDKKGGKLSFRVYAPQAKQTQNWQCKYFLSLDDQNEKSSQVKCPLDAKQNRILRRFEELFI